MALLEAKSRDGAARVKRIRMREAVEAARAAAVEARAAAKEAARVAAERAVRVAEEKAAAKEMEAAETEAAVTEAAARAAAKEVAATKAAATEAAPRAAAAVAAADAEATAKEAARAVVKPQEVATQAREGVREQPEARAIPEGASGFASDDLGAERGAALKARLAAVEER